MVGPSLLEDQKMDHMTMVFFLQSCSNQSLFIQMQAKPSSSLTLWKRYDSILRGTVLEPNVSVIEHLTTSPKENL